MLTARRQGITMSYANLLAHLTEAPRLLPRAFVSLAFSAALVSLTIGCATAQPPRPRTAYQADIAIHVVDENGSKRSLGRLVEFYSTGKRRRETRISGQAVALIDRPDLDVSWRLELERDSFEEFPITSREAILASIPNPFGPRGGEFSFVAREKLDGIPVFHYRVRGTGLWGDAWLSRDQVPLRFEGHLGSAGKSVRLQIDYEGILTGTVDPDLFSIPSYFAGYQDRAKPGDAEQVLEDNLTQQLSESRRRINNIPARVF